VEDRLNRVATEPEQLEPLLQAWRELDQQDGADAELEGEMVAALAEEADRVRALARAGDLEAAWQRLELLDAYGPLPGMDLPTLASDVEVLAEADELVTEGYRLLAQNDLTEPPGHNARARFEQALTLDPGH